VACARLASKEIIYRCHLKAALGHLMLDEIGPGEVASFRASLVERKLSEKRINNILAVLSKPMKYAVDCELIAKAPKIGRYKVERPEIVAWDFEQYARLLAAAKAEGSECEGVALARGRRLDRHDGDREPADLLRRDDDTEGTDATEDPDDEHARTGASASGGRARGGSRSAISMAARRPMARLTA
jgi:hypothetical protein